MDVAVMSKDDAIVRGLNVLLPARYRISSSEIVLQDGNDVGVLTVYWGDSIDRGVVGGALRLKHAVPDPIEHTDFILWKREIVEFRESARSSVDHLQESPEKQWLAQQPELRDGWTYALGVLCVVCPSCGFTFAAKHREPCSCGEGSAHGSAPCPYQPTYLCPACEE